MRVGGAKDLDSGNNNSLSSTHGLWETALGFCFRASPSSQTHTPWWGASAVPLFGSQSSPRSWPFFGNSSKDELRNSAICVPGAGGDKGMTVTRPFPWLDLYSLSSVLPYDINDSMTFSDLPMPAFTTPSSSLCDAWCPWRVPLTSSQNKNKNNKNTKSSSCHTCSLNHGWPTGLGIFASNTRNEIALSFFFIFFILFCFTSAIHTEVPARDLSAEPILILIRLFLDFSAVATECPN